jgi:hypothetical protein
MKKWPDKVTLWCVPGVELKRLSDGPLGTYTTSTHCSYGAQQWSQHGNVF